MWKTYKINLSANAKDPIRTDIVICQGDSGSVFEISVNGIDTTGATAQIVFRKKNGDVVESDDLMKTGSKWMYKLLGNEVSLPGIVVADVKFRTSDARISTAKFSFRVDEDTLNDSPIESSVYSSRLEDAINQANSGKVYTDEKFNLLNNDLTGIESQVADIAININIFSNLVVNGDWQPAIQAAINSGRNVLIPQIVEVNSTIIWDGKVDIIGIGKSSSGIKAKTGFTGTILETNSGQTGASHRKYGTLRDFSINGNFSATKCIHLKNGEGLTLKNLDLYQATDIVLEVGIDGSNVVNASHFENMLLAGDLTYLRPLSSFPNYCLKINATSTDNNFMNIFGYDSREAIFYDAGGENRFVQCHGWGTIADQKFAKYIFKFTSTHSQAINCFADSPLLAGYYLSGWGHQVLGSKCLVYNVGGNQTNSCVYVEIASSSGELNITNNIFWCKGTTIAYDMRIGTSFNNTNRINNNISYATNPYLKYYSEFSYPIYSGNNTFSFSFPVPLTSAAYAIDVDASWDYGNYTIARTTAGFTLTFTNTATAQKTMYIKVRMFY